MQARQALHRRNRQIILNVKMLRPYIDLTIPALVFIATAALYIRTAAPTLGGAFDSEEFQHVAYTLGIAHATGYPLYLLLGKFFLTVAPLGNIAYRMNLLSAIVGAGAATFVYLIAVTLTERRIASIAAAAIFATNAAVWRQSGVASVGPLTLLFMGAVVYSVLLWRQRRVSLSVVAFVYGLALTHHHSILLFLPVIIFFILFADLNILRRPRELLRRLVWFLIPLSIYLYIPLRGSVSGWYHNALDIFFTVPETGAGDFMRTSQVGLVEAASTLFAYLWSSFTPGGLLLLLLGAVSVFPRINRWQTALADSKIVLFLGLGTGFFITIGLLFGGEPDRYMSLPFFFLVFWFAIGAGFVQNVAEHRLAPNQPRLAQTAMAILLALPVLYTFRDNYRYADWSAFDRVYKQWNEIFSLPIPQDATVVGNWGQLNAMRYMQNVENRRRDIRPIGTLYDPTPQTDAAREAFEQQRSIFLAPGIAQPIGEYRYALLGPLLEVRDRPQTRPPDAVPIQQNISINSSLTLVGYGISTALEPYPQTTTITPTRTARVSLYWRAEGSPKPFIVRLRLYDPESRLVAQLDEPPVRGLYPTPRWIRGEYVNDIHNFLIPGGTPPGKCKITLTTLDAETKTPSGAEIDLGPLSIERATNLTRDQVFIAHPLDIALNDRIAILGYGGFEGTHRAGETLAFNLLWAARDNVREDVTVYFALTDASGKKILEWQRSPIAYYPTHEWQKGELLKAYYDIKLPSELQAVEISLALGTSTQNLKTLGKIQIAP